MNNKKDSYSRKVNRNSALVMVFLIILTIITLLPIWVLFCNATYKNSDIIKHSFNLYPHFYLFENIKELNRLADIGQVRYDCIQGYLNSLIIAGSATFLALFFGTLTAFGLSKYQFKLNKVAFVFILVFLMVPAQVTAVGFINFMIDVKLTDNYIPLIVPALASPPVVFYLKQYMDSNFHPAYVEAARIDGCSEFKTFLKIAIPMCKPAILVQGIFTFVANWNNYYTPSMILISADQPGAKRIKSPIPLMVSSVLSQDKLADLGVKYTAIFLSVLPVIILYLIFSRKIVDNVTAGGVKE